MRRLALVVLALLAAAAAFVLTRGPAERAEQPGPDDRVVLVNEQGRWTVFTRCLPGAVGPGYVARLETPTGRVLVDDELGPGTLNDTDFAATPLPGVTRSIADLVPGDVGRNRIGTLQDAPADS